MPFNFSTYPSFRANDCIIDLMWSDCPRLHLSSILRLGLDMSDKKISSNHFDAVIIGYMTGPVPTSNIFRPVRAPEIYI